MAHAWLFQQGGEREDEYGGAQEGKDLGGKGSLQKTAQRAAKRWAGDRIDEKGLLSGIRAGGLDKSGFEERQRGWGGKR